MAQGKMKAGRLAGWQTEGGKREEVIHTQMERKGVKGCTKGKNMERSEKEEVRMVRGEVNG